MSFENDDPTENLTNEFEAANQKVDLPKKGKENVVRKTKVKSTDMASLYKEAWNTVYKGLPTWRKNELDEQLKTGKLSDKSYDTAFAQQVIALAESQ